jgi:hypothetical protein
MSTYYHAPVSSQTGLVDVRRLSKLGN